MTFSFLTQSFIAKGSLYNSEYNEKNSNKSQLFMIKHIKLSLFQLLLFSF